jgi:hypothetical protein
MTSAEQEYIASRQERYRQAHNTMSLETLDPWVSKDLDYSDHGTSPFPSISILSHTLTNSSGIGVEHITKLQLKELATGFFASTKDYIFTTVSVNGSKEFTAWEWTAKGEVVKEIPGFPFKVGEEFKMMGVTLFLVGWRGYYEDGGVSEVCSLGYEI